MTPVQEIEFLGMIVNSKEMAISLPQKKIQSIKQMCQDLYQNPETTVLELTKVLGHLASKILAIIPAKLHCRFLQQQQIQALKTNDCYKNQVLLDRESQLKLPWWVKNIEIYNGRSLIKLPAQALLQTDASLTGWGDGLGRNENWRHMDSAVEDAHKRPGTSCIKTGPGDLFESTGDKVTAYSDGQ